MNVFAEFVVSLLLLIGAFFLFVGSLGLAKLPDFMRRLHGPSKATTLGIGATLIASMLFFAIIRRDPTLHEILIVVFLFLTAPVSANMLGKAHILKHHDGMNLPPTDGGSGWATLAEPSQSAEAGALDQAQRQPPR